MSSPKTLVHRKLKQRPFRILVLGQAGVGKTGEKDMVLEG